MRVRVCVRERKRDRERKRERERAKVRHDIYWENSFYCTLEYGDIKEKAAVRITESEIPFPGKIRASIFLFQCFCCFVRTVSVKFRYFKFFNLSEKSEK